MHSEGLVNLTEAVGLVPNSFAGSHTVRSQQYTPQRGLDGQIQTSVKVAQA